MSSGLLIDQVHDAATPFEGSLEVRSRFPGARLLKITGDRAVDHADVDRAAQLRPGDTVRFRWVEAP